MASKVPGGDGSPKHHATPMHGPASPEPQSPAAQALSDSISSLWNWASEQTAGAVGVAASSAMAIRDMVVTTALSNVTQLMLQPLEDQAEKTVASKKELVRDPGGRVLCELFERVADIVAGRVLPKIVNDYAEAYYLGPAGKDFFSQNKKIFEDLTNALVISAFSNITKAMKEEGIREINILTIGTFVLRFIDKAIAANKAVVLEGSPDKRSTAERIADDLLDMLFPNGQGDMGIQKGMISQLIWNTLRGYVVSAVDTKIAMDKAGADCMTNSEASDAEKDAAAEMAGHVANLAFWYAPAPTVTGFAQSALHMDEFPEGDDKKLLEMIEYQAKTVMGALDPADSQEFRKAFISFLQPIFLHIQRNNAHVDTIKPEEYNITHFIDDLVGFMNVAKNELVVGEGPLADRKMRVGRLLLHILGVDYKTYFGEDDRQLPIGEGLSKALEAFAATTVPDLVEKNSPLGKHSNAVTEEYKGRLLQCLGGDQELAERYMAGCRILGEQVVPWLQLLYIAPKKGEAPQEMSHLRDLIVTLALQILVHSLENSGPDSANPGSVTDVLNQVGASFKTLIEEEGPGIVEILDAAPTSANAAKARAEKLTALTEKFQGVSDFCVDLVGDSYGDLPFALPFGKVLSKGLLEKLLPTVFASMALDMNRMRADSEKNREALNKIKAKDGKGFGDLTAARVDDIVDRLLVDIDNAAVDQAGPIIDLLIAYAGQSESPRVQQLKAFLESKGVKGDFREQLIAFVKNNPGLIDNIKPFLRVYLTSLMLAKLMPVVTDLEMVERGFEVAPGKRKGSSNRMLADIGRGVLENVGDYFEAVNDARAIAGKRWAHEVGHREFAAYFAGGVPQTNAVIAAYNTIDQEKADIRRLRKELSIQMDLLTELEAAEYVDEASLSPVDDEGAQLVPRPVRGTTQKRIKDVFASVEERGRRAFAKFGKHEADGVVPGPVENPGKVAIEDKVREITEHLQESFKSIEACHKVIRSAQDEYVEARNRGTTAEEYVSELRGQEEFSELEREDFLERMPQTSEVVEIRTTLAKAERKIVELEVQFRKPKGKGQKLTHEDMLFNASLTADIKKQEKFINATREAARQEVTHSKFIGSRKVQSGRELDAIDKKKELVVALKAARKELKAAATGEQQTKMAEVNRINKEIAAQDAIISVERDERLERVVDKILELIKLGRSDELPVPELLKGPVLEAFRLGGRAGLRAALQQNLSRTNVQQGLRSAFTAFNNEFYGIKAEVEPTPPRKGEGFAKAAVAHTKKVYNAYYRRAEAPAEPAAPAAKGDPDLEVACGNALHKITRLIPDSMLKSAFGNQIVQDMAGQAVASLLQRPLTKETSLMDVVEMGLSTSIAAPNRSDQVKAAESDTKEMHELIKKEIETLDAEEELQKNMVQQGASAAAHAAILGIVAGFRWPAEAVRQSLNDPQNPLSPAVKKVLLAAADSVIMDVFTGLLQIAGVPILMIIETGLTWYFARRGTSVAEILYLDPTEHLADAILDTVLIELDIAIKEVKAERHAHETEQEYKKEMDLFGSVIAGWLPRVDQPDDGTNADPLNNRSESPSSPSSSSRFVLPGDDDDDDVFHDAQ